MKILLRAIIRRDEICTLKFISKLYFGGNIKLYSIEIGNSITNAKIKMLIPPGELGSDIEVIFLSSLEGPIIYESCPGSPQPCDCSHYTDNADFSHTALIRYSFRQTDTNTQTNLW